MTQLHLAELLGVTIVVAGALGGLLNFYLTYRADLVESNLWKSIALGIGASLLVPLFLNTISSHLLDDIRDQPNDQSKNVLLFFGFCLVAAISSKAFIQTVSRRILDEAREAKKVAKEANKKASEVQSAVAPLIEKETEDEAEEVTSEIVAAIPQLTENEWKILEAMAYGTKALRTRTSLGKQTNMRHEDVASIVDDLRQRGLVATKEMKKANGANIRRWYITTKGRAIVEARTSGHASNQKS